MRIRSVTDTEDVQGNCAEYAHEEQFWGVRSDETEKECSDGKEAPIYNGRAKRYVRFGTSLGEVQEQGPHCVSRKAPRNVARAIAWLG